MTQLAAQLENALTLPFVMIADAEGHFLGGYSGTVTPPYLLKTLDQLIDQEG